MVSPVRIQRVEEIRRPHSLKKSNSTLILAPRPLDYVEASINKGRNISSFLPKQTTSTIMSANSTPLQQIQQMAGRQSELSSPLFAKSSRLSSGLKVIQ